MAENLTDEKLELLINDDPEFLSTKKIIRVFTLGWFSVSGILYFVVDELAAIIEVVAGILVFLPIMLIFYVEQKKMAKTKILNNYYAKDSIDTPNTYKSNPYEYSGFNSQNSEQQKTNTLENLAINIGASYALGKTVSKAMDEHPIIKFPNDNSRNLYTNRTKVSLVKGGRGWLSILPNGNQLLTDLVDRRIAAYDAFSNETIDGNSHKIGKGNMLGQFYR